MESSLNHLDISAQLRAIARRRGREDLIEAALAGPPVFDRDGDWSGAGLPYLLARNEELFDAGLDEMFRDAELDDPRVIEWIDLNIADRRNHSHLLLQGDTGVGKTYDLHAALKRLVTAAAGRGESPSWHYTTHGELARLMQDFRTDDSKILYDKLLAVDILVLDELGTVTATDWSTRWLGELVDSRYRKCRTSLYATNNGPAQLREVMQNDRVFSRLMEGRNRIVKTGDDLRIKKTGRID